MAKRSAALLACLVCVGSFNAESSTGGGAIVHYIPFYTETFQGVTQENIECMATAVVLLDDWEPLMSHDWIKNSFSFRKFNRTHVRAKIVYRGKEFFIDSDGDMLGADGMYQVDRQGFADYLISSGRSQRIERDSSGCLDKSG